MRSKRKFRAELAKLFMMITFALILIICLLSQLSIEVIFFRVVIGTSIFGVAGYLLGLIIDQEQEKFLVQEEKEKLKQKVKENYNQAMNESEEGDFSPMEIENLSKIVVDSLKD